MKIEISQFPDGFRLKAVRRKILLIDAVRSQQSCIYQKFRDIFEENKQGFEGKSCTLTQFITYEEYKYLYGVVQYLHEENRSRFTSSKHFVTQDEYFSQRMNEHFGLCTHWQCCCLETLMELDATIDDVTGLAVVVTSSICGVELHIKLSRVSASLCTHIPR